MKLGISGSTGVLGKTLIHELDSSFSILPFKGDIRNQNEIAKWLKKCGNISAIIHLAAVVPTKEVENNPWKAFDINVGGTCKIMNEIGKYYSDKELKPWIFLASTAHVYRSTNKTISEGHDIDPINTYGLTKYQAEKWAQLFCNKYSLPLCVGRIFSFSSPIQKIPYFVPTMVELIKSSSIGMEINIPGLNGFRDFLTARQVAKIMIALLNVRSIGIYNIGSGIATSLLDVVLRLAEILSRDDLVIKVSNNETHHIVANINKLNSVIGEVPFSEIDKFLSEVILNDE